MSLDDLLRRVRQGYPVGKCPICQDEKATMMPCGRCDGCCVCFERDA